MDTVEQIAKELKAAGFRGGVYYFKPDECSCCYGLKRGFFQITGNVPGNWMNGDSKRHKITYNTDDKKKAEKFRKLANKLMEKYGLIHIKARSIHEAVMFSS